MIAKLVGNAVANAALVLALSGTVLALGAHALGSSPLPSYLKAVA